MKRIINSFFILSVAIALGAIQTACQPGAGKSQESGAEENSDMAVGFIYVGSEDDYGYNQGHAQGAAAVKSLEGVTVYEEENVSETVDVQKTMESMINMDGVKLIFPTSFGYFEPHVLEVAKKYPEVNFLHCGGLYDAAKHPANVGSYFGYIDEAVYIGGIVAGHTTRSKKLGFIAAKPIPQVLRNINAFTIGARSVDPEITVTVVFTGDWFMPVKEAEAANSLADQGIDVISSHVDSPKVIVETSEKRGIYCVGYHVDQSEIAPNAFLTGAVWNWPKVYADYVKAVLAGESVAGLKRGGLKAGIVKVAPYGPAVSDEAKASAEAAKAKFMTDDDFAIFVGPLKDNAGATVISEGDTLKQQDPVLEIMDYLVEGVVGAIPAT